MEEYLLRNDLLKKIGFDSYTQYLDSPMWRGIRARVLLENQDCRMCSLETATIVHHLKYDGKTLLGKTLANLRGLCRTCHELIEFDGDKKNSLAEANAIFERIANEPKPKQPVKKNGACAWVLIDRCACGNCVKKGREVCGKCARIKNGTFQKYIDGKRERRVDHLKQRLEKISTMNKKVKSSKKQIERERRYLATGSYE